MMPSPPTRRMRRVAVSAMYTAPATSTARPVGRPSGRRRLSAVSTGRRRAGAELSQHAGDQGRLAGAGHPAHGAVVERYEQALVGAPMRGPVRRGGRGRRERPGARGVTEQRADGLRTGPEAGGRAGARDAGPGPDWGADDRRIRPASRSAWPSGHTVTTRQDRLRQVRLGEGHRTIGLVQTKVQGPLPLVGCPGTRRQPRLSRSPQYSHAANSVAPSSWAPAKLTPGR